VLGSRAANRIGLRSPSDLSDAGWLTVEPMKRRGRRGSVNVREVPNGTLVLPVGRPPMERVAQGPAAEKHSA
jgi:hypothetical protein